LLLNPNAKIKIEDVCGVKFLIIDDFFIDPDAIRQYAKKSMVSGAVNKNIMGFEIHPHDIASKIPNYANELGCIIHKYIGDNVCDFFNIKEKVSLSAFKGPYFNCIGIDELPVYTPHVDFGHVSSFTYLNPSDSCTGGTRIYRHIPTNKMNVVQRGSPSLEWMTQKKLDKPLVESTEEWELVKFLEMKYNRLVVFNSSLIHKVDLGNGGFDMTIDNVRLCLNCFFRYINEEGEMSTRVVDKHALSR